jgi:uncharacterized membrane protein YcgQ (UPF0703/DUF1980 family)
MRRLLLATAAGALLTLIGPALSTDKNCAYSRLDALSALSLGGAPAAAAPANAEILEIKETLFLTQVNDIYINPDDYWDKLIKFEGILQSAADDGDDGLRHYFVIRYGPGCCGFDGLVGFEVVGSTNYPKDDTWVEAVGALEKAVHEGEEYLRIRLSSLNALNRRGAEIVTR